MLSSMCFALLLQNIPYRTMARTQYFPQWPEALTVTVTVNVVGGVVVEALVQRKIFDPNIHTQLSRCVYLVTAPSASACVFCYN